MANFMLPNGLEFFDDNGTKWFLVSNHYYSNFKGYMCQTENYNYTIFTKKQIVNFIDKRFQNFLNSFEV